MTVHRLLLVLAICCSGFVAFAGDEPPAPAAPPSPSAPTRKRERSAMELSLFFPIEKNSIQILPQRFEYELIDKDRFRVGNQLFDAKLFEFKVSKASTAGLLKLKVKWPAGLLGEGEISIRDNIGKAIWIYPIDKTKVAFRRQVTEETSLVTADLEGDFLPENVFRGLQFIPYFQICIQKAQLPTRISLCSRDFFAAINKGKLEIRSRDSLRQESFVNINGNKVDPQGLIFLQSLSDVLSMRVLLLSGATIDVDTRMKEVEFRDISSNQAKGRLMLNGTGAEPASSKGVVKLPDGSWRTEIALERPVIYLRGEGDIPMRQEFVLQGQVRDQTTRVDALGTLPISTYRSSVSILLKDDPKIRIESGDSQSSIEKGSDQTIEWTLHDLADGTRNRRFLNIYQNGQKFTAAWDITKYPRWDLSASLAFPLAASFALRGWLENKSLGFALQYDQFLTEWKKDVGPNSRLQIPIYWSLRPHYNWVDSTWGLSLTPTLVQFKSTSTQAVSLGGFAQWQMPRNWSWLGAWSLVDLHFYTLPLSSENKLTGEIQVHWEQIYPSEGRRYYWWGLDINQWTSQTGGNSTTLNRTGLNTGIRWQF